MFIHKPEPSNPQQIGSVYRVVPVLPVGAINTPSQELAAQAKHLTPGETYDARVMQRVSDTTFLVQINSKQTQVNPNQAQANLTQAQPLLLKMDIGQQAKLGQTLSLQYLQAQPELTFLLKQPTTVGYTGTAVNLSQAGSLLGQYLGQAEAQQLSTRYEAINVITHFPNKPQLVAQDLKQALSQTGLFYESHLQALSQGQYALSQLRQEPQNQAGFNPAHITFQQLAVLEHQRFSWHGEVWPGQTMTWDVYQQRLPSDSNAQAQSESPEATWTATELKIDFPHLGEVKAKLSLVNGHLRIHLESGRTDTFALLQQQKTKLAQTMQENHQSIDALTVTQTPTVVQERE